MLSLLELHCLNTLCDDYETVMTIRDDVQRSVHGAITEDDIGRCLFTLARKGFIGVFEFDSVAGKYVRLGAWLGDWRGKWFLISPQGRVELNATWIDA